MSGRTERRTKSAYPKAYIFDLDGTILDSLMVWEQVDIDFLSARGIDVPDDYVETVGSMSITEAAEYTIARFGLNESAKDLRREWNRRAAHAYGNTVRLKPNVKAYLLSLWERGVKLAVATSLPETLYVPALRNHGIEQVFEAFCSTDETKYGKTRPDVFLLAAKRLGVKPSECIVFEDLLAAVRSAKSIGMTVCAVYDSYSDGDWEEIKKTADFVLHDFKDAREIVGQMLKNKYERSTQMSFSRGLKNKSGKVWEDGYNHPFVQELGQGTLDKEKFKFYLLQDYQYLLQYAKVFALAAVKSDTEELMTNFSTIQYSILANEMDLHRNYMESFGVSRAEMHAVKSSLYNRTYTANLLATAQTGGLAEILAAIFPCAWTYSDYAKRLKTQYADKLEGNFYRTWIENYASDEFAESYEWFYDALDMLCQNKTDAELNKVTEIFVSSVEFEYLFWDMAYKTEMSYSLTQE